MPEKPILFFPTAKQVKRVKRKQGRGGLQLPPPDQQRQRLDAKFRGILNSVAGVQPGIGGLDPESVIVLEVIGDVDDLAKAAENVAGLEWLAEIDRDEISQAGGFAVPGKPNEKLPLRLFAMMTNQQAMQQLLRLWDQWTRHPDQRARSGFGPFKNVFKHLHDVRLWGPKDRLLDTGALEYWRENLAHQVDPVRFQIELWCRRSEAARQGAYANLQAVVQQLGGQCIRQRAVTEILYHGVLVDVPRAQVEEAVRHILDGTYTELLRLNEVMFFRPVAQMASPLSETPGDGLADPALAEAPTPVGPPVVALLDGSPLENHASLAGRLVIDDPDGLAARYGPGQQQHGTAMASLIAHGDLSAPGEPLGRPIYARPIFLPYPDFQGCVREAMPDDQLPVDVLERAVRRLFEGDGSEPATAPTVRVINLSLGDSSLPFSRDISPMARLLDWLAWKYNVLFVVSAGNQTQDIVLSCTRAELGSKAEAEIFRLALQAVLDDQAFRRPYSPAEAINAVTVGAVHADRCGNYQLGYRRDPFGGRRLSSPLSTVSSGFRRAVKPEILMEGGRQLYYDHLNGDQQPAVLRIQSGKISPGQLVASPGRLPRELNKTAFCCGTSNAAALASRAAATIYDRLASLTEEPGGDRLSEEWTAVLVKTLLVHGASWAGAAGVIQQAIPTNLDWRARDSLTRRLLGYGEADPARSLAGTEKRVLLLGWDSIAADEAHEYALPLPSALAAQRYRRRLTVTLGWITPVNLRHRAYRRASLSLDLPAPRLKEGLGLETADLDRNESSRGTVQHLVFEGEEAIPFADGAELTLKVNCRADAGDLDTTVRYALAVTLEIADPVIVDIHQEIQERVRARARLAAAAD